MGSNGLVGVTRIALYGRVLDGAVGLGRRQQGKTVGVGCLIITFVAGLWLSSTLLERDTTVTIHTIPPVLARTCGIRVDVACDGDVCVMRDRAPGGDFEYWKSLWRAPKQLFYSSLDGLYWIEFHDRPCIGLRSGIFGRSYGNIQVRPELPPHSCTVQHRTYNTTVSAVNDVHTRVRSIDLCNHLATLRDDPVYALVGP